MIYKFLSVVSFLAGVLAIDIPQQLHLAFAGQGSDGYPSGFAVSWQTMQQTGSTTVKFGTSADKLTMTATGFQNSYYATWDHHVELLNLQKATTYYYQCGDDEAGWSEVSSFQTMKSNDGFKLAIVGDMGIWHSENTINLLHQMSSQGEFDWVWHVGDISYADDDFIHANQLFEFGYENVWNEYMNEIEGFASRMAYMTCPGNHEAECHSPACQLDYSKLEQLSNFTAYESRFHMPSESSGGNTNMWYSFNYGPVHFVNLNTETNYEGAPLDHYTWYKPGNGGFYGDQSAWLVSDLQSVDRSVTPWVIVGGHRPIYALSNCNDQGQPGGSYANMQMAFEDIFYENGVDFYIAGHVHSYERQKSVYNVTNIDDSTSNMKYTCHIVSGGSGSDEYLTEYSRQPPNEGIAWNSNYYVNDYGFSTLDIDYDSIHLRYYRATTGEMVDEEIYSKTMIID